MRIHLVTGAVAGLLLVGCSASAPTEPGDDPDTIDIANWATVDDPDFPFDPEAPDLSAVDVTDIPTVTAPCTGSTLTLQGPDAALASNWVR